MEKATMCIIVDRIAGAEIIDNIITIPFGKKNELIDEIAKALEEQDDIIIDDIEGDTIIIPSLMLLEARRIQFTDIEREEE